MRRRISFFTVAAVAATVAFVASGPQVAGAQSIVDPPAALRVFQERVESYAALHRRLAPPRPTARSTDPISRLLTGQYLASAIRGARRYAEQGEIFTPEVARMFRARLADSVGERDGETFLLELGGGEPLLHVHPTVNEPYSMTRIYFVPDEVRLGLPDLPRELDYRIASRDLLLWDISAGIVVDFVPDAFTASVTTE